MAIHDLHGFTAVAELKRLSPGDLYSRINGDLHGFTAVAELKPADPAPARIVPDHLHGFTAVAELKPQ